MKIHDSRVSRVRELRKDSTAAESVLWAGLRNRQLCGYRFEHQHPIGLYIVDFVCLASHLVIELDAAQHQESVEYDSERAGYLSGHGFSVIRFETIRF